MIITDNIMPQIHSLPAVIDDFFTIAEQQWRLIDMIIMQCYNHTVRH